MLEWIGSRAASQLSPRRNPSRRSGTRGFTLIEALCAVAVLAIALTALLQTYSRGLRAVRVTDNYTTARILAESVLDETIATPGQPAQRNGNFGGFNWKVSVAPASIAKTEGKKPAPIALFLVSVEVFWPPSRSIALSSMKLVQGQ